MPSCSILIPTHNRAAILSRTLDSLSRIQVPAGVSVELVVIANACTDDTNAAVARSAPPLPFPVRCIPEPAPGLSLARNRAVREAKHDLLLFLDDDVQVDPGWLAAHLRLFDQHRADLTTGRIDLWWDQVQDPGWLTFDMKVSLGLHDLGPGDFELRDDRIRGGNFGFRRAVFDRVGTFSESLGRKGAALLSGEESLFARDALAAGFRIWYSQSAAIKHLVTPARLEPAYLSRLARSMSFSIARMRPRLGPVGLVRGLGMGAARLAWHTLGRTLAVTTNNFGAGVRHRVKMGVGIGQLGGTWARAVRGHVRRGDNIRGGP